MDRPGRMSNKIFVYRNYGKLGFFSNSRIITMNDVRDINKANITSMVKKTSSGLNLDENSSTQIKLMPILEGGENEDKSIEQQPGQVNASISRTINWTPSEYVKVKS
jgi:hypothetical protein